MDIILELGNTPDGICPAWLEILDRNGKKSRLDWNGALRSALPGGTVKWTLCGVYYAGNGCRPDEDDLSRARLADAGWCDDDEEPVNGSAEIVYAAAFDSEDAWTVILGGTPAVFPAAIDYKSLDHGVRSLVEYFNGCGLRTEASHGVSGLMKIFFHPSVGKNALTGFPGGWPSKGTFCTMLTPDGERLAYVAASAADVSLDLVKWQTRYPAPAAVHSGTCNHA